MKICVWVFLGVLLVSGVVSAQVVNSSVPSAPVTTSVSSLVDQIKFLEGKIDSLGRDNAEMRAQFDMKLSRMRQSDQLFYFGFNVALLCALVFLQAVYKRLMWSRFKKRFLSFEDRAISKVDEIRRRLSLVESSILGIQKLLMEKELGLLPSPPKKEKKGFLFGLFGFLRKKKVIKEGP